MKKFQKRSWSYLIGNHICRSGFISKPAQQQVTSTKIIKVIKSDGTVMMYDRPITVSALLFEFPEHKICNSESLYIGQKISALSRDEQLQLSHDYFLLPIHFFDSALTFVTITSFAAAASKICNVKTPSLSNCPLFEIQKTDSGFLKIRVREEFICKLTEAAAKENENNRKMMMLVEKNIITTPSNSSTWFKGKCCKINEVNSLLSDKRISRPVCTTPELQKEYMQLVLGRHNRPWKPKLETITETRRSEIKKSSNRKRVAQLLVAASFGVKRRSSVSNRSSPRNGVAPANKSFLGTNNESSSRTSTIHKTKTSIKGEFSCVPLSAH